MDFTQRALELFRGTDLEPQFAAIQEVVDARCVPEVNGHIPKWETALNALPLPAVGELALNASRVGATSATEPTAEAIDVMRKALMPFCPWRKGPFEVHGVHIDTEWRSDFKWERIAQHLDDLQGRTVLDVGCGNGYHVWRMLGAGAKRVLGIDPNLLFCYQFEVIARLMGEPQGAAFLPIGADDLPEGLALFDTVFSMGVLYHRKSPIDHLYQLKDTLCKGGQLVLETLVVEGDGKTSLTPEDRYGKMRNVWFIPSPELCMTWLNRCGYKDVACVDVNVTSLEEQRRTPWMQFESLANYLDENDRSITVEGYPAPRRAVFVARA